MTLLILTSADGTTALINVRADEVDAVTEFLLSTVKIVTVEEVH